MEESTITRVYKCYNCGKVGQWSDGWAWYGSMASMEHGHYIDTCSQECRKKLGDVSEIFRKKFGRSPDSEYYK